MIGVWIEYETVLFFLYLVLGILLFVDGRIIVKFIYKKFIKKSKVIEENEDVEQVKINVNDILKSEGKWYEKLIRLVNHFSFEIFHIFAVILIVEFAYNLFLIPPGVQYQYPLQDQALLSYETPIYIVFDRPISEANFTPYIFPEISGEWRLESVSSLFPYVKRKAVFYPKESMFEGKVFIYYAGLTNIFGTGDKWEYGVDSMAVKLPTTANANTDNNEIDFPTDGNLEFILDEPYGRQVEIEFEIEPQINYFVNKVEGNKIIIDFDGTLGQSKDYKYKLYKTPVRYNIQSGEILERGERVILKEGAFKTIREPLIKTIEPNGSEVKVDSQIVITFDQPMLSDMVISNFSITPTIPGYLTTTDNYTYTYIASEKMVKETKYEIKISKGLKSLKGGYIETDIYHTFNSIGRAKVSSFSPGGNATNISRGSSVIVNFNQEVDHASAQSKFSIVPAVEGVFSWNGNSMIFNPNIDFAYVATYTVTLGSGIKSLYGIDSNEVFSTKFTTESQYFVLNVPIYHQTIRYACQFYATAMAVAYKTGSYKDPMALYGQVAKDNTAPTCDPSTQAIVTWGNPYSGYVGDVYGNPISGCSRSGYGVYWGPVSSVISGYRSNSIHSGWNVTDMLKEVQAGNPVVIWAHNGYSYAGQIFYWQTTGGSTIRAVSGMHSYVVVGYIGSPEDPTSIILNDPNRGRWTISTSYFKSLWSYFNNTGIVVY